MPFGDRGPDTVDHRVHVDVPDPLAVDLLYDDELFGGVGWQRDRERRPAAPQQRRVAVLRGGFQVVGVVVRPADDDEVLEPSGDEQFAVEQESHIAGAQERPAPGVGEERREGFLRFGRLAQVALCNAGPGDPDFPDLVGAALPPRDRIGDHRLHTVLHRAATDERRRTRVLGRHVDDVVVAQRDRVDVPPHRFGGLRPGGHQQGRLGQPVHRPERGVPETRRGEGVGEPLQGGGIHRFGTRHRRRPVRQVQRRPFGGAGAFHAQVVGEIRGDTDIRAGFRQRFQPPHRVLDECLGRHQITAAAQVQRAEHRPDQTHVVMQRQPGRHNGGLVAVDRPTDGLQVGEQVAVGQHNTFRRTRGARGVLHQHRCIRVEVGGYPVGGDVGFVDVGRTPPQGGGVGHAVHRGLEFRVRVRGGQYEARSRIGDDRGDAGEDPGPHRRMHRDRNGAGIDAAEKAGDEVQPGGAQHQHPFTGGALPLQPARDCPGLEVELVVAEPMVFCAATRVVRVVEHHLVAIPHGPVPHQVKQCRRRDQSTLV
ncbi:hypothetical protein C1Y40_04894 [Mycobacterium talmoniae]|uniref:Uncharacterized protein n=1 Tax=Mycobacterium talmoniae TaxID=1858794 RepID=A0A2S8BE90_9MYCO|nr:hypothetical protein C1Y40_04894 [Mycobacterium talmoniae]